MSLMWYDPYRSYRFPEPLDFLGSLVPKEFQRTINRPLLSMFSELDSGAQVTFDKDKFNVNVDVQQFRPEEISVKVKDDNSITIEGKHEERQDDHGYVSRQFVRRYVLPKDHDFSRLESKLSSDGVLSISAPKIGDPTSKERHIPITHTGRPSKAIEHKVYKK